MKKHLIYLVYFSLCITQCAQTKPSAFEIRETFKKIQLFELKVSPELTDPISDQSTPPCLVIQEEPAINTRQLFDWFSKVLRTLIEHQALNIPDLTYFQTLPLEKLNNFYNWLDTIQVLMIDIETLFIKMNAVPPAQHDAERRLRKLEIVRKIVATQDQIQLITETRQPHLDRHSQSANRTCTNWVSFIEKAMEELPTINCKKKPDQCSPSHRDTDDFFDPSNKVTDYYDDLLAYPSKGIPTII